MQNKLTTLTPFLVVKNGKEAAEFYQAGFGAEILDRFEGPDGRLTARISVDGAEFWMGDEEPEYDNLSPETVGGTAARFVLTVEDPDTLFTKALNAGAKQICPMTTEESWRIGKLSDPSGHIWEIGKPLDSSPTSQT